jgi:endonuclease III
MKLDQVLKQMHLLKKIKRLITEHNPEITRDMIVELYDCIESYDFFIAPVEVQNEVGTEIYNELVKKYESESKLTLTKIKAIVKRVARMGMYKYHRKRLREIEARLAAKPDIELTKDSDDD